jgi:hypothetical protein
MRFIALLLFAINLWGQTATVTGTITRRNGDAAVNVTVTAAGRHRLTDVRGRCKVTGVPCGETGFAGSDVGCECSFRRAR